MIRARRLSPVMSASCAHGCQTGVSFGSKTAKKHCKAVCQAFRKSRSKPSLALSVKKPHALPLWQNNWHQLYRPIKKRPGRQRSYAKPIWSRAWYMSFPNYKALWAAITRKMTAWVTLSPPPFATITNLWGRAMRFLKRVKRARWRWPTKSTVWPGFGQSMRSRPARKTRSRCAAPRWALSVFCWRPKRASL